MVLMLMVQTPIFLGRINPLKDGKSIVVYTWACISQKHNLMCYSDLPYPLIMCEPSPLCQFVLLEV